MSSRRTFVKAFCGGGAFIGGSGLLGSGCSGGGDPRLGTGPRGWLDVREFGVLGDGQHDDRAALDMMFERHVPSTGGAVLFPPGRYRLVGHLDIPPHVTVTIARGGVFQIEDRLRIRGTLEAGMYQIFDGGSVQIDPGGAMWHLPQWWGARGDGEHNDAPALESAIRHRTVMLPAGEYRVTRDVRLVNGSRLVGVGNSWSPTRHGDSWIRYDGPRRDRTCVLRAAAAPVGGPATSPISNVQVDNIVLDGGNQAGYGLYSVYATNDSSFNNVTARNCTQHGVFIANQWYASYRNIVARDNPGCGITIGRTLEGWRNHGVNGVSFSNLRAANNGGDERFDEESNLRWGYGIYFGPGAGTTLRNPVSESNYGSGIVYALGSRSVNRIDGGYVEANGAGGSRPWGLIVIGHSNARANAVDGMYLGGTPGQRHAQHIWLTGSRPAGDLVLRDVAFGAGIRSDWDRYRFEGHVFHGVRGNIRGTSPRRD